MPSGLFDIPWKFFYPNVTFKYSKRCCYIASEEFEHGRILEEFARDTYYIQQRHNSPSHSLHDIMSCHFRTRAPPVSMRWRRCTNEFPVLGDFANPEMSRASAQAAPY